MAWAYITARSVCREIGKLKLLRDINVQCDTDIVIATKNIILFVFYYEVTSVAATEFKDS